MRLAWSNRIALLGAALGVSSFVFALLYEQLRGDHPGSSLSNGASPTPRGVPIIDGLPFKANVTVPLTSRFIRAGQFYEQVKEYERKGRLRDAGQSYANAIEAMDAPLDSYSLSLWDDYSRFLRQYGATAASDEIARLANYHRHKI